MKTMKLNELNGLFNQKGKQAYCKPDFNKETKQ